MILKTLFLSFFIITGVLSQLQGQVIAKWTMLRLFDPVTPSIYLNGEWNAYKSSNKKTLQGSLGYGFWGNLQENERNITQTKTIRLGLEHRYYFQEKFNGRYISVGIETRNAFYDAEEWETVCPTNDCFEQLKSQRFIRNSYSLTFKLGKMRHVGSNIYFENYIGMGVKFSKKTGTNSEIDDIYILKKDHYLFPMLSCGIRLGYMFKPKE